MNRWMYGQIDCVLLKSFARIRLAEKRIKDCYAFCYVSQICSFHRSLSSFNVLIVGITFNILQMNG